MPAEGLAEKSDNYGTKTAKIMGPSVMEGPTLYTLDILEFPGVSSGKGNSLFREIKKIIPALADKILNFRIEVHPGAAQVAGFLLRL